MAIEIKNRLRDSDSKNIVVNGNNMRDGIRKKKQQQR